MAKKEELPPKIIQGCPDWMLTFGDCMSLLLTFFVLLISFSDQDDAKLLEVLGSMKGAFGLIPLPNYKLSRKVVRDPKDMTKLIENESQLDDERQRVQVDQLSPVLLSKVHIKKQFEEIKRGLVASGFENMVTMDILEDGVHFKIKKNDLFEEPELLILTFKAEELIAPLANLLIQGDIDGDENKKNEIRLVDHFFQGEKDGWNKGLLRCASFAEFLKNRFRIELTRLGYSVQPAEKSESNLFEIILMNPIKEDQVTLEEFAESVRKR